MSTPSKRLRLEIKTFKGKNYVNCHGVWYNLDLLGKIISYLKIPEILKKIIILHKNSSNYINLNPKSIPTIKQCIKHDFGDFMSSQVTQVGKITSSKHVIHLYYYSF